MIVALLLIVSILLFCFFITLYYVNETVKNYTNAKLNKELPNKKIPDLLIAISLILVVSLILFALFAPYYFTGIGSSIKFTANTGQIGDTIGGTMGPFVALSAAILTFIAFWVQYQSNLEQKKQFEKLNQDQLFFKQMDSQLLRVINTSFLSEDIEYKSFQAFELIAKDFKMQIESQLPLFARQLIRKSPEKLTDFYLSQMFELNYGGGPSSKIIVNQEFTELKVNFLSNIARMNDNERWEFIKGYFNSAGNENKVQKELLLDIGNVYFYKVEYEIRYYIYRKAFEEIELKFGSLLDGYLRGFEFICNYTITSINKEVYISFIKSQLSKFEMIILFYYIASGYADNSFKNFVESNRLLDNLHYYSTYFIDIPGEEEMKTELKNILQ